MSIMNLEVIQAYIRMCNDGWLQNWHERNGGNLTYRLKPDEVDLCEKYFIDNNDWVPMGITAKNLANEYFVATGSGKFFRNVILSPEENLSIAQINENGDSYRIVWGLTKGGKPTSEFPSHILNHSVKKAVNDEYRVIYHAHPANVIALTFVLPLNDKSITRALWESATECPVVFPNGVGVVPWMVPGGADIAVATSELMKKYDAAIWAHHGIFCAGPDFDITFGLMHTIEKAAEIHIKALSCGLGIRQTIGSDNLKIIAKEFGVELNTEFLD